MLKEYQNILSNQSVRCAVRLWGCAVGSLHYRLILKHMRLAQRNHESAIIELTFTLHCCVSQSKTWFLWTLTEIGSREFRIISLGTLHAALMTKSTNVLGYTRCRSTPLSSDEVWSSLSSLVRRCGVEKLSKEGSIRFDTSLRCKEIELSRLNRNDMKSLPF